MSYRSLERTPRSRTPARGRRARGLWRVRGPQCRLSVATCSQNVYTTLTHSHTRIKTTHNDRSPSACAQMVAHDRPHTVPGACSRAPFTRRMPHASSCVTANHPTRNCATCSETG
eukprot:scaffold132289_cov60-Phaeocystis_antarctica.AAC.2